MPGESALSGEAKAIIASNLVSTVALLRAHRWDEKQAKAYAMKLYAEFRATLDQEGAS